mgnify:CR=1 FL=1
MPASASCACTIWPHGVSHRCSAPVKKAALAFTEALTQIGAHGVSDALYRSVAEHFSDVEISELNFAIVAINAWNRLGITSRMALGSLDAAYGLNKANLE